MKMDNHSVTDDLVSEGVFALLAVLTADGEVVLRPIGGDWGYDITDAAKEMASRYPNCKMRLYEHGYNAFRRYFSGEISPEQMLP